MSSLIVASDLDLMMLEISIEQLVVPRSSEFDKALLKKTVAMFRLLDKDWTSIYPQRTDYQVYRGSNSEIEPFNGGVSVLFPIPESCLEAEVDKIDLQLHVRRELSKYFELQSSEVVGIACIDVSDLFNGVIAGLRKSREDPGRVPVAKSSKDTYALIREDGTESGAEVTVYLRLSHLGNSLISEIEVPDDTKLRFYAKEETSHGLPYQLKEIAIDDLTGGCWGSDTLVPPKDPKETMCCCCDDSRNKDRSKIVNSNDSQRIGKDDRGQSGSGGDDRGGKGGSGKNGKGDEGENDNDKDKYKDKGKGKDKDKEKDKDKDNDNVNGNKNRNRNRNGNKNKEKDNNKGSGNEEDVSGGNVVDDDQEAVSCLTKPALCGREGTCNKKDKKGKFGKCGKPDGEGGNPLACGERRKCARRRSAAGSATVGIVDKKAPCPRPPVVCRCPPPVRSCPSTAWPTPPCPTPCPRFQSVNYYGSNTGQHNFCQNYDTRRFLFPVSAGCGSMHFG